MFAKCCIISHPGVALELAGHAQDQTFLEVNRAILKENELKVLKKNWTRLPTRQSYL